MQHNFRICNSENAIICGKICDMWVLANYAMSLVHCHLCLMRVVMLNQSTSRSKSVYVATYVVKKSEEHNVV